MPQEKDDVTDTNAMAYKISFVKKVVIIFGKSTLRYLSLLYSFVRKLAILLGFGEGSIAMHLFEIVMKRIILNVVRTMFVPACYSRRSNNHLG